MTNYKITSPEEGPMKYWLTEVAGVEKKGGQSLEKSKLSFAWKITLLDICILSLIMF